MELESRVRIVHDFFRAWETSASELRPYLTKDVEWWTPWGTSNWDNYDLVAPAVRDNIAKPIKFTVKGIVAQGDRLAVEANAYVPLKNGKIYDQNYHFLMEFAGDKIKVVKEYFDTKHASEVWGPILAAYIP